MFECFKTHTNQHGRTVTAYEADHWQDDAVIFWGDWVTVTNLGGTTMAGGLPLYKGNGEYAGYHLEYKR